MVHIHTNKWLKAQTHAYTCNHRDGIQTMSKKKKKVVYSRFNTCTERKREDGKHSHSEDGKYLFTADQCVSHLSLKTVATHVDSIESIFIIDQHIVKFKVH